MNDNIKMALSILKNRVEALIDENDFRAKFMRETELEIIKLQNAIAELSRENKIPEGDL